MKMLFEEKKNAAKIALIVVWVSAIIFFAGLVIFLGNFSDEMNSVATSIAIIGGFLLLGSYLILKYQMHAVKMFQEID